MLIQANYTETVSLTMTWATVSFEYQTQHQVASKMWLVPISLHLVWKLCLPPSMLLWRSC